MGKSFDERLDGLEKGIRGVFQQQDREMLRFAKKLRRSKGFRAFSDETRARINLYIKAYEEDEEALLLLSLMLPRANSGQTADQPQFLEKSTDL